MWPCDQSLTTPAFQLEKLSQPGFYKDSTRKDFFGGSVIGSSSIIWDWH